MKNKHKTDCRLSGLTRVVFYRRLKFRADVLAYVSVRIMQPSGNALTLFRGMFSIYLSIATLFTSGEQVLAGV